jgi:hypothetical protein
MTGRKSMHGARGARARVSVNFRKFSPCIARTGRTRAGLTVYPPSRTLELLAKQTMNIAVLILPSAFFMLIKRGSIYPHTMDHNGIPW